MPRHFLSVKKLMLISLLTLNMAACQSSDSQDTQQNTQQAAPKVDVVSLIPQTVTIKTELPARTVAFRQAEVRPQVNGIIQNRLFEEGADVKAGQQLYQIDEAPFQAALQMAKAELARARANIQSTKARAERFRGLIDNKAISQQDYDDAQAAYLQAQAEVSVAQANIQTAEINLRYTKVNAPIDGRIGRSTMTEGALVTAQQESPLTTITQTDPIYVDISQASKEVLRLRRQLLSGRVSEEDTAQVKLTLEDGSTYQHQGELQFSEVNVNEDTGSLVMRAKFPNPDGLLLPGMYVKTEINEGTMPDAILVPHKAVMFSREGTASVMLVNDDNIVEQRPIAVRHSIGHKWLVSDGLSGGEKVVVEGLQKIAVDSAVEIEIDTENSLQQAQE
ncbi:MULTISPECIES: efflux RND transporter periplasmic adaptor subunit [unclassified Methylophaga]|jgi:membrane fusion protein (multidrug efflux system)|uniref:efflux RND transporter periplasmic adaptor subunit n=4 Tax=Methylophaga TaxID=40222 RepID=UPI000C48E778|nr:MULTISPECIES: efflux RND transporter periplasmic adaptor subunit [unclassified Methylophaga]MAL49963.1 efflux transporter periplasmic adaptor subunit [Methylophaga sp.]MBP26206.1 efflux transporter periplasmic adaptor subunit [Methylophaga sp.]MDX1751289.1 efflux RND transporter periplasmic adaptor subunit [Methylophaga sp.]HCC80608.1 efflux transporter periplasmic adaptor subunit [Methylophaga sp.]|tara:strand:- start:678 stop:1850 length:1173 start_codon:yes stop_codon:yes gene_type:complete